MENRIPLPTDNIFKFYALFGLLLFVFGWGAIIYIHNKTNDLIFQAQIDLGTIKQLANPSPADLARESVLQKQITIAAGDANFYNKALAVVWVISILLMGYGFAKWHKDVQPLQDSILKLQLEKLRLEVNGMRPKASMTAVETEQEI